MEEDGGVLEGEELEADRPTTTPPPLELEPKLVRGRRPRGFARPGWARFLLRAEAPKGTPAGLVETPGMGWQSLPLR